MAYKTTGGQLQLQVRNVWTKYSSGVFLKKKQMAIWVVEEVRS